MTTHPLAYRTAQAIGFSGAAWLSGNIASLSLLTVPALLRSSTTTTTNTKSIPLNLIIKTWHQIYESGKAQNPPIAAATATAFVYLAWTVSRAVEPPQLLQRLSNSTSTVSPAAWYAAAAGLVLSIVPFTAVVMQGTNAALIRLSESPAELTAQEEMESRELLKRWGWLNGARSILPLAGGLVGIAAACV
ncbi:DUF1772 domain-containing protein [Aspergillus saccharolyticus JOP 1030-1]|uniref:DUF1772-domain-containing protein n=1 Tax=Aspergillus saccharolyticus JOP 1030-1 TaxID=1450539 RepID=A0A318ZPE0_9EURO|nr:DUF1772-domain-containing protein [Aspergillus saccharolyticus JOP 1030-1]PYH46313.1 DUF1772-domain-containing protein [Aspergillus saccharolyticus JOP 1030-1]